MDLRRARSASIRMRSAVLAVVTTLAASAAFFAGASDTSFVLDYREHDESIVALNILPPGQGRHLNALQAGQALGQGVHPPHNTDQIGLYEGLIRAVGGLSEQTLNDWFTDASFGVKPGDEGRTYSPGGRSGLVVIRDLSKDVPHVYGETRTDVMYGAGYVSAEDRLFVMDVLRHLGRGRLSEFLGASESNLAADRAVRRAADYTEAELEAMIDRTIANNPALGETGRADLMAYSEGINRFIQEAIADPQKLPAIYPALQTVPKPWKPTDSVAISAYIGGVFSVGGGGQLTNAAFIQALMDEGYTFAQARQLMEELRFTNDPEAPTAADDVFNYNASLPAPDPAAVAFPDDARAVLASMEPSMLPETIDTPFGPIPTPLANKGASNALLVAPSHSATGRPLAVMGPQVGYYSPEIFMEIDMHGPGIHARGGAFPGISLYILIGRGDDYAWSATTAIGDHNDIRAVKLCDPDGGAVSLQSTHYLLDGVCKPMYVRTDSWVAKPSAAGTPTVPGTSAGAAVVMTTQRVSLGDVQGIVQARGKVGGEPVAFVRQRTSYMADIDSAATYVELMDPDKVNGVQDLQQLFDRFNYSFNWHFIAPDGVGFYTTGTYPKLAPGVDPDLPFWGDSAYDYTGYLSFSEHPQTFNPAKGYVTNWNNKQAPGFRAADDWWGYGPVGRVSLLTDGVEQALSDDGKISMLELVTAMQVAATQDVRGAEVLPYMLEVLGTTADPRLQNAIDLLNEWSDEGSHRRDLTGDGQYEHQAAVLIMDEFWSRAVRAAFTPKLGEAVDALPMIFDDGAGPTGSAYLEGWYGQLQKDLRQVLGKPVAQPFSSPFCGLGSRTACRQALLQALSAALTSIEAEQGTDTASWDFDESNDKIKFSSLDLVSPRSMAWQNRPTFQQVLSF